MLMLRNGTIADERKIHVRRFREDRTVSYSINHPNARIARSLIAQPTFPEAQGA
jgi:hypothetical protein